MNNKLHLVGSKYVIEIIDNELKQFVHEVLQSELGISCAEEINHIPGNTVYIENGEVKYNSETILWLFGQNLISYFDMAEGRIKPNLWRVVKGFFLIRRNIQIIDLNEEINRRNQNYRRKFLTNNYILDRILEIQEELLPALDLSEDEIHYLTGGTGDVKSLIQNIISKVSLQQLIDEIKANIGPTLKLIHKRNELLK